MKANAPEKIYLFENPISGTPDDRWLSKRSDENDVEYIRTDFVIEWIKNKVDKYIVDTPMCCYFDHKRAIEDFKNYMKGE